jgi:hypothetical protein
MKSLQHWGLRALAFGALIAFGSVFATPVSADDDAKHYRGHGYGYGHDYGRGHDRHPHYGYRDYRWNQSRHWDRHHRRHWGSGYAADPFHGRNWRWCPERRRYVRIDSNWDNRYDYGYDYSYDDHYDNHGGYDAHDRPHRGHW